MARRKRASMREGPLADLFRSTVDDPPADPPEAPEELSRQKPSQQEADPDAPRYGRRDPAARAPLEPDRKSTRLNSSHLVISYAVFCLKKKNNTNKHHY